MSHVQGLAMRQRPSSASFPDDEAPFPFETGIPPVLIQVPTVRPVRPARRPSAVAMARVRGNALRRSRRRLRREVRVAGYLLLTVAPLALAVGLLLLLRTPAASAGGSDGPAADRAAVRPPTVWLSIEAPGPESVAPVVLPGYVLPDDGSGSEETTHAGG